MVTILKKILLLSVAFFSASLHANWHGANSGIIHSIDVTQANNYGIRVTLEGGAKLCGNANSFAYLNKSDDNYQAYLSVLLAAKFAKSVVVIYANRDANGYCQIGYISVV